MSERPVLHHERVKQDWVDYNGHMNVAYYVLIFDHATDAFLEQAGLDETYRKTTGGSVFVVESHIIYLQEVLAGSEVEISTQVLNVDAKRLHLLHSMAVAGSDQPAATIEIMILHVNLDSRRSAPFDRVVRSRLDAISRQHSALPVPAEAGRQILFKRPKDRI
jgi:acyl-CoA thioester hydrolase